jgi:hypothetical protein
MLVSLHYITDDSCSFIAMVHKHGQLSAESGTLPQYCSSMLFWSERIYRQRGVEPPSSGRLDWALTQVSKFLESRAQQQHAQTREDDLHDEDSKDTLSDTGSQPRTKRTKMQSYQASHEHTELPEITPVNPNNDPSIVPAVLSNPINVPGAIATDSESILEYFAMHPPPGSRSVTIEEAMQYFVDNPPPDSKSVTLDEAAQYFVDNPPPHSKIVTLDEALQYFVEHPPGGTGLATAALAQANLEADREEELKGKREGKGAMEKQETMKQGPEPEKTDDLRDEQRKKQRKEEREEEEDTEHNDVFEGFED